MQVRQTSVIKALFNVIGGCSFIALSACAQPVTQTPTTTIPTITASPTSATSNQNLARQLQSLASQGQLQTLAKAVQAAGLTDRLSAPGPYTVFAPSDPAFAALPKTTLDNLLKPANKQKLVQLLSYHIVPGRLTAAQLKSGQVKTLEGNSLTIKVDPTTNTVTVNGATVTQPDILASNGIIHIVDQVLLPPKFKVTQ